MAKQSNLDSFFGVPKAKRVKNQASLDKFVTKKKKGHVVEEKKSKEDGNNNKVNNDSDDDETTKDEKKVIVRGRKKKSNNKNDTENKSKQEEDNQNTTVAVNTSSSPSSKNKKKRRIIVDDDSSDEEEETPSKEEEKDKEEQSSPKEKEESKTETKKVISNKKKQQKKKKKEESPKSSEKKKLSAFERRVLENKRLRKQQQQKEEDDDEDVEMEDEKEEESASEDDEQPQPKKKRKTTKETSEESSTTKKLSAFERRVLENKRLREKQQEGTKKKNGRIIDGDLLDLASADEFDVIVHGCNCYNAMGAGIAKQIKLRFPEAYSADAKTEKGSKDKLGTYSKANPNDNLTIVNAYIQHGTASYGEDVVDYDAVQSVFRKIKEEFSGKRIGYPKIGAGLAGGDWKKIYGIIENELKDEDHTLVNYVEKKKNEKKKNDDDDDDDSSVEEEEMNDDDDEEELDDDEMLDDDDEEEENKKTISSLSSKASKKKKTKASSSKKQPALWEDDDDDTDPSWKEGTNLPYKIVCETLEKIEATTKRLEIQSLLTKLFRRVLKNASVKEDLYHLLYLSSNTVAPSYQCIELGIGDAILIKAIGEAYGTNPSIIKQKYEAEGDLGIVAASSKGKQRTISFGAKPKVLSAKDVLEVFRTIAQTTGSQSQKWKVNNIKKLLVRAQQNTSEAKYIIRGLQGKLRIGLARSTVLISLAHALCLSPPKSIQEGGDNDDKEEDDSLPEEATMYRNNTKKSQRPQRLEAAVMIIKKAYSEVPSYDAVLDACFKVPLDKLHLACTLTPGIPVEPMLAKPTKSIQEVLKRLNGQRFTCEFKYDGERAQVHLLEDGTTRVFSRNLLDTTEKYPEVPQYVKEASSPDKKVTSFVLDTEVVAFNRETGKLVPFQVLSTRKKTEESAESAKVQVIVQAFDLMYLNGTSLLSKTLSERRELMRQHFVPVESKFQYAKSLDHKEDGDTTILEEFLDTAVKGQCEGLMVKTLDENAAYEPSKRSLNWLKLKKDYLEGLGDSVDLVPLGAYYGKGKRTGVYGAYLLACYDPDTEEFQSVCKIGTGFSDEILASLTKSFEDKVVDTKPHQYNTVLDCDVWFDACTVWEIKAADLSKSSTHRGAVGRITGEGDHRGIGLRFPRFERIRDDKSPEQATTSTQILELYYQQDSVVGGGDGGNDEDGGI